MYTSYRIISSIVLLMCVIIYSVNGSSIARHRQKRYISNRIEKNGFDITSALKNLNNGYKYVSNVFSKQDHNQKQDSRVLSSVGSSSLSGVSNCDDCFLGILLAGPVETTADLIIDSRREACAWCCIDCRLLSVGGAPEEAFKTCCSVWALTVCRYEPL